MIFILISPIIVLLFGASLELIVSSKKNLQFCIASITSLVSLLFSSIILTQVIRQGVLVMSVGDWGAMGITLVSDRLSAIMLVISNIIGFVCLVYS